jgi:ribonuclease P protein component
LRTKKSPISPLGTEGKTRSIQPHRQTFGRREHLKKRVEISVVFKKGRISACSGAKLFFLVNNLSCNRIVITFARKYGNAVKRNRVRRLNQEAYRLMKEDLKTGYDLVLLIYPQKSAPDTPPGPKGGGSPPGFARTTGQLKVLFKKAGIL